MKSKNESNNKLMMLLMMVASGSIEVTEDQVAGITHILMSSMDDSAVSVNASTPEGNDLVWGIAGLARLMNCSTVSAQRMRNEGRFDEAMYKFGKKLAWDRKKVLEIAKAQK